MKKEFTFADKAKALQKKYYKVRKPGEDSMTDEAFNREMRALMQLQESVKPNEGATEGLSEGANGSFAHGGNLPKFDGISQMVNFLPKKNNLLYGTDYDNDISALESDISKTSVDNIAPSLNADSLYNYTPKANILAPIISTATSGIATSILSDRMGNRKDALLKNVNFGRINPQKIDLSRERANIKSNQALSDATGRYVAKNAASASEAVNLINQSRLRSQRVAGDLLGQSLQKEELTNAELRARADEENRRLAAEEAQMRLGIESQYGGANDQLWADFAKTTGQSAINYLQENQRMNDFYNELNMLNPNYELDFQNKYKKLSPRLQKLARLGLYNPGYTKVIRDGKVQ